MRAATAVIIFVLVLLADVSFTPQTAHLFNPQQVTRLALAWSLGEGHLEIDRFAGNTVDRASFDGHAYADKPPGQSLLAVPAVLVARIMLHDADPLEPNNLAAYLSAAVIATVAIPGALAATLLYLLCLLLGASRRNAIVAAAALGLGTPFLGWSTLLFVHVLSGSVLLSGFALASWKPPAFGRGLVIGIILGLPLIIDITQAPAAAVIGVYSLWRSGRRAETFAGLLLGGVLGLSTLLAYNALAFGSPFHLGYSDVVGFAGMKQGFFGLSAPDPGVLVQLLFGLYRGLLPLTPILILVPVGLARLWPRARATVVTVAAVIGCALLINASYFYWDGGSATGPRHLIAMLPIAAIGLAFVDPKSRWGRAGLYLLLLASALISGICASTEMLSDASHAAPFFDDILPRFLADPARILRLLIPWLGFAALLLWPEGHQLSARPLEAAT